VGSRAAVGRAAYGTAEPRGAAEAVGDERNRKETRSSGSTASLPTRDCRRRERDTYLGRPAARPRRRVWHGARRDGEGVELV
jgi:hypothetical protein